MSPFLQTLIIAIGLSADAFAVSITRGVKNCKLSIFQALKISLTFGFFQAFMPLLGWAGGRFFKNIILGVDHWVASILLFIVGGKMIIDAFMPHKDDNRQFCNKVLLSLALATSIDAFAVGVTLSLLATPLIPAVILIGLITAIVSLCGVYIGKFASENLGSKAEIGGGALLIIMAVKILIEQL